ncbi:MULTISPECIES: hypothetical protein [Shouchella]|nr:MULTISPECIES: hypothetical protein [Shouchella]MBX0320681.1 hypothetical protein [Shouchella clausii]MDO7285189.1 hypothetical protein [Shouchella clausii]MDO7305284.1 hypothetical protein [Shouchella clausii]
MKHAAMLSIKETRQVPLQFVAFDSLYHQNEIPQNRSIKEKVEGENRVYK